MIEKMRTLSPMATDPRRAETLDEAARNPDGTYHGARALSWLSEALTPGKGMSEAEVQAIWNDEKAKLSKSR